MGKNALAKKRVRRIVCLSGESLIRPFGKVLRGGAWNNNQDNARAASRNRNNPNNRNNNIGFRVVRAMFVRALLLAPKALSLWERDG